MIELLVVIAIIAILAAILFPVFTSAKVKAYQSNCASNLKQIGISTAMYMSDSNGRFPLWHRSGSSNAGWFDAVKEYSKCPIIARCPSDKDVYSGSTMDSPDYWKNSYLDMWSTNSGCPPPCETGVRFSKTTVFLMDGPPGGSSGNTWWGPPRTWTTQGKDYLRLCIRAERRHGGAANVLFADWHVKLVKPTEFTSNRKNSPAGNWLNEASLGYGCKPTGIWLDGNDGIHPWFRPN